MKIQSLDLYSYDHTTHIWHSENTQTSTPHRRQHWLSHIQPIKITGRNTETKQMNCKNSKQLAQDLKSPKVEPDEILISHDVISLFTKTPAEATVNIVEELEGHKLTEHRNTREDTGNVTLTYEEETTQLPFGHKDPTLEQWRHKNKNAQEANAH